MALKSLPDLFVQGICGVQILLKLIEKPLFMTPNWRAALRLAVKYSDSCVVHQTRCEERDLPADSFICHILFSPRISSPGVRRRAVQI